MTTTISSPDRFGSFLRGQCKKNIPMMIYLAVLGFIGLPLQYIIAMVRCWTDEYGVHHYSNISTPDPGGIYANIAVGLIPFLWMAATLILAISATNYMHNRRAVDLYHALPITRHQLLLGNAVATFITVSLPMTVNYILTFALAAIRKGLAPEETVLDLGAACLDLLGWYVTCFAVISIIMLVATQVGSTFDTFMFSGVFLAALPVMYLAHHLMCTSYLTGYCEELNGRLLSSLSPAFLMPGYSLNRSQQDSWFFGGLAAWLVLGVLLLLCAMALYRRRPSERAESHARTGIAVALFRFLVIFLGGLGFGTLFSLVTELPQLACIALWGALVYLLIEAILCRGFRGIGKKSLLTGLVMLLITLGYAFGLMQGGFGFVNRIPQPTEVQSVTIDYRGRYEQFDYFDAEGGWSYEYWEEPEDNNSFYIRYHYPAIESITLQGEEPAALTAELHRAVLAKHGFGSVSPLTGARYTIEEWDEGPYRSIHITYRLKNGRTIQRRYNSIACTGSINTLLDRLEDTEEFRSKADPLYHWQAAENPYTSLRLAGLTNPNTVEITEQEPMLRILEALRHDTLRETSSQFYSESRQTVCYLYLDSAIAGKWLREKATEDFFGSCTYSISTGYTETLAVLEDLGLLAQVNDDRWQDAIVAQWGFDLTHAGRALLPNWHGDDMLFLQDQFSNTVRLNREEAETLLALSHTVHPNSGRDNCLYLMLNYPTAEHPEMLGLPVFVYYEDALACGIPALNELLSDFYDMEYYEKYGYYEEKYGYPDPATVDMVYPDESTTVIGGADAPTTIVVG